MGHLVLYGYVQHIFKTIATCNGYVNQKYFRNFKTPEDHAFHYGVKLT